MLFTILIIVLVLLCVGALPAWPHASAWGYGPVSLFGVLLFVVLAYLVVSGQGLHRVWW